MNRVHTMAFRSLVAFILLWLFFAGNTKAQTPPSQETKKPAETNADQKKAQEDPFAPAPAPPLPAGMTGSDANDPRAKLKPGWYDAGEISKGLKHLQLFKKPDAFRLDSADPNNAKVQKTLGMMGVRDPSKMPKPMQLMTAQLAFANSDMRSRETICFRAIFMASISLTSRIPLTSSC